jgi:hypothetical protein
MKKQKNSHCQETKALLQNITERQRELYKLTSNMQDFFVSQKSIEVDFEWKSKIEESMEFMKLSKAV